MNITETFRVAFHHSRGAFPNQIDYMTVKQFKDSSSYKEFNNKNDTSGWYEYKGELKRGTYCNIGSIMNPVWKKV